VTAAADARLEDRRGIAAVDEGLIRARALDGHALRQRQGLGVGSGRDLDRIAVVRFVDRARYRRARARGIETIGAGIARRIGVEDLRLVRPDVTPRGDRVGAQETALVRREQVAVVVATSRDVTRVDGGTARKQRVGLGRSAVVLQRAKAGIDHGAPAAADLVVALVRERTPRRIAQDVVAL